MPQLDFGNPLTIAQVVWMALIFFTLYLLLSRVALPRVAEVLETRRVTIERDLETARAAKDEADRAVAELTEASRQARAESQAAIADAAAGAKRAADEDSHALNERLGAQLADAERQIADARAQAMASLRQVATEAADALFSRLTGRAPDAAAMSEAVAQASAARQA